MWDINLTDGVIISLLFITSFLIMTFLGVVFISAIISSHKNFSNRAAFILAVLIGTVIVATGNYIFILFGFMSYEFSSLPSVSTILLLAYVGPKMNRRANLEAESKLRELELRAVLLRAVLWIALIVFIGSIVYMLAYEGYLDILNIYIYLGYALAISLPAAILAGFLLGFIIKKIPRPAFLNWPIWKRIANTVHWAVAGIRKRIGNHPIPKIIAFILFALGAFYSITYIRLTIPSDRELWRIKDNILEDPMIVNNLILFEGNKGEDLHNRCEYIYAVDKNTGKPVWSSENYTMDQYCNHSWGPVYTAIILLAKNDVILVSSSYWITDDEQGYVLYALSDSSGELLWKINGYAGYPYAGSALLNYSSADTNYIYVASKGGSFSAIDSSSGKLLWKQRIPSVDYTEDILIEYNNQVVYYYYSGNDSITAFDARDGNQLWEKSNLNYVRYFIVSGDLIYLPTYSYTDLATTRGSIGSPYYLTALDRMTGEQAWELTFDQNFPQWVEIIGNKIYILTHDSEGFGDNFKALRSLIVVNKNTGGEVWQFNEDYSHGDMNYFIQDNMVYVGTKDNYLFALDDTGKTIWQAKNSGFPYSFYVNEGTLVVVYEEKYAAGFDTKTGKQKWMLDVGMDKNWYPDDFIITDHDVIYIAGAANRTVYAINIETGEILWTWNHYHPRDKAYMLKALDGDVLYVDQYRRFLGYDWFFALNTEPE